MQKYPEELSSVVKSTLAAALAGMIYGGLPAARHARERFIQLHQAEIYHSRVEAVVSVCGCELTAGRYIHTMSVLLYTFSQVQQKHIVCQFKKKNVCLVLMEALCCRCSPPAFCP